MRIEVSQQRLTLKHAFTHFKITLHVFEAKWVGGEPKALEAAAFKWVRTSQLVDYAMGKTDRAIARSIVAEKGSH